MVWLDSPHSGAGEDGRRPYFTETRPNIKSLGIYESVAANDPPRLLITAFPMCPSSTGCLSLALPVCISWRVSEKPSKERFAFEDCATRHNLNQLSRRWSATSVLETLTELTCDATTVSMTTAGSARSYHLVQRAKVGNLAFFRNAGSGDESIT